MMTEDLAVFFNTGDFAVAAVYDAAGTPATVNVIHDHAYLEGAGIGGTNPLALAKASDIPEGSSIGKTLTIAGVVYTIIAREPQDDGAIVLLQLQR